MKEKRYKEKYINLIALKILAVSNIANKKFFIIA